MALPFNVFSVLPMCNEVGVYTVYKVKFNAIITIPAGYDTSPNVVDPLNKNPIGMIKLSFNTKDYFVNGANGFNLNLGRSGTVIPCVPISGIIPK